MRGMVASVTSCIGGKDEKFAVRVRPAAPARVYFVYKTMSEFDALWTALESLASDVKTRQEAASLPRPSVLAQWLASIVDHYAFRQIISDLRAQQKETMSALNVFLQFLVRRVAALYVEKSILRCGSCRVGRQLARLVRDFLQVPTPTATALKDRKRQFAEMRPEDAEEQRSCAGTKSLFPVRATGERAAKTQKLCGMRELCMPPLSCPMVAPVASRRRVFAEVDF
ncbi:hypothetical protein BBJ28_00006108 [Nothophytophthora sp. Chile5]|nr:hypothetical protein BBJ28_00006108 [Nothophytophthora sp. Chile5]